MAAPFRSVKTGPWRREFASDRVRVVFRDLGENWDLADIQITLVPVKKPADTAYHAFESGGKLRITAGIERPVAHIRPTDIDQIIRELQLTKQDILDIEALIREQFPSIPLKED